MLQVSSGSEAAVRPVMAIPVSGGVKRSPTTKLGALIRPLFLLQWLQELQQARE